MQYFCITFYHGVPNMARSRMLQVRLSDKEFDILEEYAKQQNISMPEVVRDYIKSLKPKLEAQEARLQKQAHQMDS